MRNLEHLDGLVESSEERVESVDRVTRGQIRQLRKVAAERCVIDLIINIFGSFRASPPNLADNLSDRNGRVGVSWRIADRLTKVLRLCDGLLRFFACAIRVIALE